VSDDGLVDVACGATFNCDQDIYYLRISDRKETMSSKGLRYFLSHCQGRLEAIVTGVLFSRNSPFGESSLTYSPSQNVRVGHTVEDWCRPCKSFRAHTVMVVSGDAKPLRVTCDTCGSQHNFRGHAPRVQTKTAPEPGRPATEAPSGERNRAPMGESNSENQGDLEQLLRRIIREETGLTPVVPADRWRGGEIVLRPGKPGLQEKTIPIDNFFQKIVSVRNRLRVLEQQVNAVDVPVELKIKLQSYITGCYGSLTSFNILFADEADRFRGSGKREE